MPIIFQKMILREDLIKNRTVLYLFGDNLKETGFGGQAKEMRGEPNAIGIPTKVSPSEYLNDSYLETMNLMLKSKFSFLTVCKRDGRIIIIPTDGIGTGLAKLRDKAPKINSLLGGYLNELIYS
jgi:hypothetical protein